MEHRVIVGGLVVAIAASVAGFPFEAPGAHAWSGFLFIVWALAVFAAARLLALQTARASNDLAAVGFTAVALCGLGTTLNSSLLARGAAGHPAGDPEHDGRGAPSDTAGPPPCSLQRNGSDAHRQVATHDPGARFDQAGSVTVRQHHRFEHGSPRGPQPRRQHAEQPDHEVVR